MEQPAAPSVDSLPDHRRVFAIITAQVKQPSAAKSPPAAAYPAEAIENRCSVCTPRHVCGAPSVPWPSPVQLSQECRRRSAKPLDRARGVHCFVTLAERMRKSTMPLREISQQKAEIVVTSSATGRSKTVVTKAWRGSTRRSAFPCAAARSDSKFFVRQVCVVHSKGIGELMPECRPWFQNFVCGNVRCRLRPSPSTVR